MNHFTCTAEIDLDDLAYRVADCDSLAQNVANRIDADDIARDIDLCDLAGYLCVEDVASHIDVTDLVPYIDYNELGEHVDMERLAEALPIHGSELLPTGTEMFECMIDGLNAVVNDLTSEDKAARSCGQMRAAQFIAVINKLNTGLIAALQEAAAPVAAPEPEVTVPVGPAFVDPVVAELAKDEDMPTGCDC